LNLFKDSQRARNITSSLFSFQRSEPVEKGAKHLSCQFLACQSFLNFRPNSEFILQSDLFLVNTFFCIFFLAYIRRSGVIHPDTVVPFLACP
jgi:hypothetical protein